MALAENASFVPPAVSCKVPRSSWHWLPSSRPPTASARACLPSPPHETCNQKEPIRVQNKLRSMCRSEAGPLRVEYLHTPLQHHQAYLPWSSRRPSLTKVALSCPSGWGRLAVLGGGLEMSETHAGMRQSLSQVMETGNSKVWVPGRKWNLVSQLSQS